MAYCNSCGNVPRENAKSIPHSFRLLQHRQWEHLKLIGIAYALLAMLFLAGCAPIQQDIYLIETTPTPVPTPETVYDIDIREMLELLKSNEVAAEAEYKGKLIRTTGIVDDIEKDRLRLIPLDSDAFQMSGLRCHLVKNQEQLILGLRKGDEVTIQGRHRGFDRFLVDYAEIRDCQLLQPALEESVAVPTPTADFLPTPTLSPATPAPTQAPKPISTSIPSVNPTPTLTPSQIFKLLDQGDISTEEAQALLSREGDVAKASEPTPALPSQGTAIPTPTTPVSLPGLGHHEREGVAITLHSVNLVGETIVRVEFTIENIAVSPFIYSPSRTSIQTDDGGRWDYDFGAYNEEMHRQAFLPEINTGDLVRMTEGYIIPQGTKPVKFFYEHPSYGVPDFSFLLSNP